MQSRITIEVDFDNGNQPVIQVLSAPSDDVRDNLVSSFLQSLQHSSRWAKFEYQGTYEKAAGDGVKNKWFIRPITPQEIESEISLMQAIFNKDKKAAPQSDFKQAVVENGIPRRNRLDLNSATESAIRKSMEYVEDMGAHPILTDAIMHLDAAFNLVADYIEGRR